MRQPIAIVGLSGIYPRANDLRAFWKHLNSDADAFQRIAPLYPQFKWDAGQLASIAGHFGAFVQPPRISLKRHGIPPIFKQSVPRILLLMLHCVEQALQNLGVPLNELPLENTDIVCGTGFAPDIVYKNGACIDTSGLLAALSPHHALATAEGRRRFFDSLEYDRQVRLDPGGFNDKLYELAASLAAQISVRFKFRGKALAVQSADLTGLYAIKAATDNLGANESDMAVVVCGQLLENPYIHLAFNERGLLARRRMAPFDVENRGYLLGEGVGALVLMRLADAVTKGVRIRGVIQGIGLSHAPSRGGVAYGSQTRSRALAISRAYNGSPVASEDIDFIECFGSGFARETEKELLSLKQIYGQNKTVRLGCVKSRIGHTFANSVVAALTKLSLCFEHAYLPPQMSACKIQLPPGFKVLQHRGCPWPARAAGRRSRCAAVNCSGLGGGHGHMILEDYAAKSKTSARNQKTATVRHEPIAIIGVESVFGACPDTKTFWQRLKNGVVSLGPVGERTLPRRLFFNQDEFDPLKSYTDVAAVATIPELSCSRFRIVPNRMKALDRSQLAGLWVSSQAIRGLNLTDSLKERTAVILGANFNIENDRRAGARVYLDSVSRRVVELLERSDLSQVIRNEAQSRLEDWVAANYDPVDSNTLDGALADGLSGLIANALGLGGGHMVIQAACASSMAAFDIACNGLRQDDFDLALAGGVELGANHYELILCSRMQLLSRSVVTPFDTAADGFSIGDGACVFVLKRLSDSLRDKDPIYGVIRSIGASSDANSMMAPDPRGQILAIRRAFGKVAFSPDDVDYVEMHGTGTAVGDIVECMSVSKTYGAENRDIPLYMGSCKAIIGHTMAAAGAAGLLSALLAMRHGLIPPNPGIRTLNKKLPLNGMPAVFPTTATPWPDKRKNPRRAAVSSFGTGGINYHLIVEEKHTGG